MSSSLELFIDGINQLMSYQINKTQYECESKLRDKLQEFRSTEYFASASEQRCITIELNKCKLKLSMLRKKIENYDSSCKEIAFKLVEELENSINNLRTIRNKY